MGRVLVRSGGRRRRRDCRVGLARHRDFDRNGRGLRGFTGRHALLTGSRDSVILGTSSTLIEPRSGTLRPMRRSLLLLVTIAVHGCWLAQSGVSSDMPRASRSMSSFLAAEADMTGTLTRSTGRRSHSNEGTRERREVPPTAGGLPRQVSDFYPMIRTGQGLNRNTVDTRTLCNPGRRALMRLQR